MNGPSARRLSLWTALAMTDCFSSPCCSVSGGSAGLFSQLDADTYTLVVTPAAGTASGTIQVDVGTDAARSLVDGDASTVDIALYSYGSCASGLTGCDPATGSPDTFIFGFGSIVNINNTPQVVSEDGIDVILRENVADSCLDWP